MTVVIRSGFSERTVESARWVVGSQYKWCLHHSSVDTISSLCWWLTSRPNGVVERVGGFLSNTDMSTSVFRFDLKTLPVDFVECLMRFLPTENEVKVFRLYERERKPLENLSDEDRFMMQFSKIERLMQKMTIMAFIGNFAESIQMLTPVSGPALAGERVQRDIESFLSFLVSSRIVLHTMGCKDSFPELSRLHFYFGHFFFSHCICQLNVKMMNFHFPYCYSPPQNAIYCVYACPLGFHFNTWD